MIKASARDCSLNKTRNVLSAPDHFQDPSDPVLDLSDPYFTPTNSS